MTPVRRISNTEVKPTPRQIRAEVWMSLIHGSRGLIYFVHQFEPRFIEASLLEDDELLPAVTAIHRQILELAPVLNSPTVTDAARVTTADPDTPVAVMCKRHEGATYLFAVCIRNRPTRATFHLADSPSHATAEVLGEGRTVKIRDNRFEEEFAPYAVHLYRLLEAE